MVDYFVIVAVCTLLQILLVISLRQQPFLASTIISCYVHRTFVTSHVVLRAQFSFTQKRWSSKNLIGCLESSWVHPPDAKKKITLSW